MYKFIKRLFVLSAFLLPTTLFAADSSLPINNSYGTFNIDTFLNASTEHRFAVETRASSLATYSASTAAVASASSATDFCTLTGSATKTIRVTQLRFGGTLTTAANALIKVTKRSTADSSGTSQNLVEVPHDSSDSAATATALVYTANPTVGTTVGDLAAYRLFFPAPATATTTNDPFIFEYGLLSEPVVLRGTGEVLVVNLNAATLTGSLLNCGFTWTEE